MSASSSPARKVTFVDGIGLPAPRQAGRSERNIQPMGESSVDPRIRKSYFTLEELAGGWGLPGADLRYVAENGLLKLSVRVIGIYMEFGIWEEADEGEPQMSIPCEHRYHDGLVNMRTREIFTLFRDGIVEATYFLHGDGYAALLRDDQVRMPCGPLTSWCATTSCRGSRPRCCRPYASTPQSSEISVTSGTSAAAIVSHQRGRKCCAYPPQRRAERNPLAVRQGGARRDRLAVSEAR